MQVYIHSFMAPATGIVNLDFNLPGDVKTIRGVEVLANEDPLSPTYDQQAIGELALQMNQKQPYRLTVNRYDRILNEQTNTFESRYDVATDTDDNNPVKCQEFPIGCNKRVTGMYRNISGTALETKIYFYYD